MFHMSRLHFDESGFAWTLDSDRAGVVQTGYQLQVSNDREFTKILWDSGDVASADSVCVPYAGPVLPASNVCYWRVRAQDNHTETSGWSDTASFITAAERLIGQFVTAETEDDAGVSRGKLFRKCFDLAGEVEQAVVHTTALGVYEFYFNGQVVGDAVLAPGWTEYDKRLLYQTWDVTTLLHSGENVAGAMVGPGWYKGDLGWLSLRNGKGLRNVYGKRTAFFMQLEITYKDGRRQTIVTSEDWKCADGPITYTELYHGETYDARMERDGWNSPGFDDTDWGDVEVLAQDMSVVVPQDGPLVRRQEILPVKEMATTPQGETVLDFGQNLSGRVRFAVKGRAGDVVKLRHAEVLDRHGNFYTENLRNARCEVIYTLRGAERETYEAFFTFQGFRYICVDTWPGGINPDDFKAVVIHSDMEQMGAFECSHELLNQLHSNILWGLKGNFVDIPTDCPQRDERMGWTGDAQVFARTSTYLMDTRNFFRKWLRDLSAAQFENGGVPFVVPDVLTGNFGDGDIIANAESVAGWGDAAVICPWVMYFAYGDTNILKEAWDSMKAWVEYIRGRASGGALWNTDYQLGDWVALDAKEGSYFGATATDLVATAYYAKCVEILVETAERLGLEADRDTYAALYTDIKKAYDDEFFSKTGRLVSPTQTAHILSLAFGLVPEEHASRAVGDLIALLAENDGHLTTGFLGTPYFCQVLADNGHLDEAYKLLLKEDYPSWLYQVTKGATTVWEHWDGIKPDGTMWSANMNSFNHYAYGSVGEFIYRVIAGIDTDAEHVGYKRIKLHPRPGGGLTFAKASLMTPYGAVVSDWRIDGGTFTLNATVPHNTTAEVLLPDGTVHEAGSGTHNFSCRI